MPSKKNLVILISGRGSNLQSIIDQCKNSALPANISAVISNRPDAKGLQRAREAHVPEFALDHKKFKDRGKFDQALMKLIDQFNPDLVVLAGFMRVLGKPFIRHYSNRLINIHPSLLPRFPGLNTHARAIEAGHKTHGATVHFVTPKVDAGPIIIQAQVPIEPGDSPETLAERVLAEEHRILPQAIKWFLDNRLQIKDNAVLVDQQVLPEQGLISPEKW